MNNIDILIGIVIGVALERPLKVSFTLQKFIKQQKDKKKQQKEQKQQLDKPVEKSDGKTE